MTPTIFGVLVFGIGLVLLARAGMVSMLLFVLGATLFGGSAAIELPALGGSTIPPAHLALVFLLLRAILPGPRQMERLGRAIADNMFLIVFALYGSITAWILPYLFAGAMEVTPLRPGAIRQLFEAAPIHFSSQNITTSVYLLGTLVAGVGAYIGAARDDSAMRIARASIVIAVTHALFGFLSIAVAGTPLDAVIEFFRNGHYAQLDQSIQGLSRMNGIWPEASGFAAFGGAWLIFMTELWLRDVYPRRTGPAALLLGLALLISTSSTAYVTLGGYGVVLILRAAALPQSTPFPKMLGIFAAVFFGITITVAALAFSPSLVDSFSRIIAVMTVEKADSSSGIQRLFWARQGLDAFAVSAGVGIGAGTFRSSSLITAIIGSMGIIGVVSFASHLLRAFKPLRASTYSAAARGADAVGAAASWAALLMLMPAAVASPSPDPGVLWATFAGLALGLRSRQAAKASDSSAHLRTTSIREVRAAT